MHTLLILEISIVQTVQICERQAEALLNLNFTRMYCSTISFYFLKKTTTNKVAQSTVTTKLCQLTRRYKDNPAFVRWWGLEIKPLGPRYAEVESFACTAPLWPRAAPQRANQPVRLIFLYLHHAALFASAGAWDDSALNRFRVYRCVHTWCDDHVLPWA